MKYIAYLIFIGFILIDVDCYKNKFIKPTQDDIDNYEVTTPPDYDSTNFNKTYDPRFVIAMKKEEVIKILGIPDTIVIVEQPWAKQEKLIYYSKKNKVKIFYIEDGGVVGIEDK